jgi:hypothetical protein
MSANGKSVASRARSAAAADDVSSLYQLRLRLRPSVLKSLKIVAVQEGASLTDVLSRIVTDAVSVSASQK